VFPPPVEDVVTAVADEGEEEDVDTVVNKNETRRNF
jgi:hypothetical protein